MEIKELLEKQEKITTQFQGRLRRAVSESGLDRDKLKESIKEQIPEQLAKRSIKLGLEWLKNG